MPRHEFIAQTSLARGTELAAMIAACCAIAYSSAKRTISVLPWSPMLSAQLSDACLTREGDLFVGANGAWYVLLQR